MDKPLSEMLTALLDGESVDWEAAAQGGERRRRRVRTLRSLAEIISAQRTVQPLRSVAPSTGASRAERVTETLGRWGPYILLEHLGAGTSADVFRAYDPRLDRHLALKLLTPFHSGPDRGDAVITEGRNLARVRHPNVAAVYAAERLGGRVGIAMELVRGHSLEQIHSADGAFDAETTVAVGIQLCDALEAVHQAGLIHRDVKAQNAVREPGGRLVLTDFGAAVEHVGIPLSVMAGTPAYTAPEVFLGHDASARGDLYSLGVLLFWMLTGRYPVEGDTIAAIRQSHRDRHQRHLLELRDDVPAALAEVVAKALAYHPEDRYASAGAMRHALQRNLATTPHERRRDVGRRWLAFAAVTMALMAALVGGLAFRDRTQSSSSSASLAIKANDWVLVAQFENATGDSHLNAAVTYAIERELARSHTVNVIPRERVEDALRMMKRPLDAVVDERLAREVAARDGAVRVIIAGRVGNIGSRYVVDARLLDPQTAQFLAATTAEADDATGLADASRMVATRVRELLGGAATAVHGSPPLERATTHSLNALRLYSESYRMGRQNQWPGALELAQQAVSADPDFATAQIWLAWALMNTGAPFHTYIASAERALELAGGADNAERLWITASYYTMIEDDKRAEGAYQALLQVDPGHVWAVGNLTNIYRRQNRLRDIMPYELRAAELRPNDALTNFGIAHRLTTLLGDFDKARPFVKRFKVTAPPEMNEQLAWAYYFDAAERLAKRDSAGATVAITSILRELEAAPDWLRDPLLGKAVRYFLTTGQARLAHAALGRFTDRQFFYPYYRAFTAFAREDWNTARDYVRDVQFNVLSASAVWLMCRVGLAEHAEQWLAGQPVSQASIDRTVGGSLRVARGDVQGAIPMLEATRARKVPGQHARAIRDLSEAWVKQGMEDHATRLLREAFYFDRDADTNLDGPYGHEWMPNAMLLAELCYRRGCITEAEAVRKDLNALLASADADFPLRVRLNRLPRK